MKRIRTRLILLAIAFVAALIVYALSDFYGHLNKFSFYIKNEEQVFARRELDEVIRFYRLTDRIKLRFLADRLIFSDAFLWQAAYDCLIKDNEKIVSDLQSKTEDPRAAHLLGITRFRKAKALYEAGERREALRMLLQDASRDFEMAVRNGSDSNFDDRFNYDLTSDSAAALKALRLPKPKHMIPMWRPGLNPPPGGGLPGKNDPFGGEKDGNLPPGSPRKKG
ncbi:MAG: hypothetical protein AAB884_00735 [Patescibacteria group bacterium]